MYNRELITFITVAEKGSFLKAAKELYITPASVMNQMNKLEDIIGVKLIERTNQGALLTNAGHSVYRDAKQMIEFADNAVKKARQIAASEQYIIRIGTSILRPCKRLIDLWTKIENETLPFQLRIVPFDDEPVSLESVLSKSKDSVDCFVSPCDSIEWREKYNILLLDKIPCRIAVPRKHHLSKKDKLNWKDLYGETLMLIKGGDSPILNQIRRDISNNHHEIKITDIPNHYDTSVFNKCEQMNYLMESLDLWRDIHPSLLTLPMEWEYEMPYGIVYSKKPSKTVEQFIKIIKNAI